MTGRLRPMRILKARHKLEDSQPIRGFTGTISNSYKVLSARIKHLKEILGISITSGKDTDILRQKARAAEEYTAIREHLRELLADGKLK